MLKLMYLIHPTPNIWEKKKIGFFSPPGAKIIEILSVRAWRKTVEDGRGLHDTEQLHDETDVEVWLPTKMSALY